MTFRATILGLLATSVSACGSSDGESPDAGGDPRVDAGLVSTPDGGSDGASDGRTDAGPTVPVPVRKSVECAAGDATCAVFVSGSGSGHMCALMRDGRVWCWGRDRPDLDGSNNDANYHALGRGGAVVANDAARPQPVPNLDHVTQLSVGTHYDACARKDDGTVWCWGQNESEQLGPFPPLGTPPGSVDPASLHQVMMAPVDEVHLGSSRACAIATADRSLLCWGSAGTDPRTLTSLLLPPSPLPTFGVGILAVATSESYDPATDTFLPNVLTLQADRSVLSSGPGRIGALSRPYSQDLVTFPGAQLLFQTGVVTTTASAYVSGKGGMPEAFYAPTPQLLVDVSSTTRTIVDLGLSLTETFALTSAGDLYMWGDNGTSQLAVPSYAAITVFLPRLQADLEGKVVSFAYAPEASCASTVDGSVYCWGSNIGGALGEGTVNANERPLPKAVVI